MIITERDLQIVNYMKRVKYSTTKILADMFFNNGGKNYYIIAIKRLKKLVDNGYFNSIPANNKKVGRPMTLYYVDDVTLDKTNLNHALSIANLSYELTKNNAYIVDVEVEKYYSEKIRIDALYKVVYNKKKRLFIVEFDITKKFNVTKYEYFKKSGEWKNYFKVFPRIVSVSNKKSISNLINIININENLDNLELLLELIK